jgi:hypothetical protein
MWKIISAAALVSVVSGCVTSEGPMAQRSSAVRAASVQAPQSADRAARPQQSARAPMIIGAAY